MTKTAPIHIEVKDLRAQIPNLNVGDKIFLSGIVFTARDAAHKRIHYKIENKLPLPFDIKDAVIYYTGPTPPPPGMPIGSCGPTTSCRMDKYTPELLDLGLVATIGKGERSEIVQESIKKNRAIYFSAIGGAGAVSCKYVKSCEVIAFEDLGCESVKKLYLENFPLFVSYI